MCCKSVTFIVAPAVDLERVYLTLQKDTKLPDRRQRLDALGFVWKVR